MYCIKCGKENDDSSKFCKYCGATIITTKTETPVSNEPSFSNENPGNNNYSASSDSLNIGNSTDAETKKTGFKPVIICAVIVLVLAVFGVVLFSIISNKKNSGNVSVSDAETMAGTGSDNYDGNPDTLFTNPDEEPLYSLDWLSEINLGRVDIEPGERNAGITWSDNARKEFLSGNLNRYETAWAQLSDKSTGHVVDLYFYKDPDSGKIVKAILNEYGESETLRTVFYYNDGKPELICRNSVPFSYDSYSVKDGAGERYYFKDDVLAGWGTVDDDENPTMEMQFINPRNSDTDIAYSDLKTSQKRTYDDIENVMLNKSYAVYDRLMEGGFIGSITGCVRDTEGNPVPDLRVELRRALDGVLLYAGTTGDSGKFHIFVNLDDTETALLVSGGDKYRIIRVGGVNLLSGMVTADYSDLVLINIDVQIHEYTLSVADAFDWKNIASTDPIMNNGTGDDGTGNAAGSATFLGDADVVVRNGVSVKSGQSVFEGKTDKDGFINLSLAPGNYTAQVEKSGYETMYVTLNIGTDISSQTIYMVPESGKDKTTVLLTWDEGDTDLDLVIADGDGKYIVSDAGDEGSSGGNYVASDNAYGCEYAVLNTSGLENYRVYVRNYTDCEVGNFASVSIFNIHVHIYIINNGILTEYHLPSGDGGVLWEVAEISGSKNVSLSRVYSDIDPSGYFAGSKNGNIDEITELANANLALFERLITTRDSVSSTLVSENATQAIIDGDVKTIIENLYNLNCDGKQSEAKYYPRVPSSVRKWDETGDYEYVSFIPLSDLENDIRSILGRDPGLSSYNGMMFADYKGETCIKNENAAVGGPAEEWDYVHDISGITYAGGGKWNVELNVYEKGPELGLCYDIPLCTVTFTIVQNSGSSYGFNVVGYKKGPSLVSDMSWVSKYMNYLDKWDIFSIVNRYDGCFIYLDDDNIPEMVVKNVGYGDDTYVCTIKNGKVVVAYIASCGTASFNNELKYLPGKDQIFRDHLCGNILAHPFDEQSVVFNVVKNAGVREADINIIYESFEEWDCDHEDPVLLDSGENSYDVPGYDPDAPWVDIEFSLIYYKC